MFESHENSYFSHDLRNLMVALRLDTFASNLPILGRIERQMNTCKRAGTKTMRGHNIPANALISGWNSLARL